MGCAGLDVAPPSTSATSSSPHPPSPPSPRQLHPYCAERTTWAGKIQYAGVTSPRGMRNFVAKILLPAASPLKPCSANPRLKPQSLPAVVPVQSVELMMLTPTPAAREPANWTGVLLSAVPS